jgi:hypothetical protein
VKHFNRGTVWGTVKDLKVRKTKEKRRPYAEMRILCPSERYGNVVVHARLWGAEAVEQMREAFKDDPARQYRFTGQLEQLKDRERVLTGYNLFRAEASDEPLKRAVFILTGELTENMEAMKVAVRLEKEYQQETVFDIAPGDVDVPDLNIGDTIFVKGALRDMDAYYGGSGDVRPVAEKVEVRQKGGFAL